MKTTKKEEFPGYPQYAQDEDIYNKAKEETELDPETKKLKTPVDEESEEEPKELNFEEEDLPGDDLDVPGSDLDDDEEETGSEDEENNYYSLGSDNNQEEDQGL